MSLNKKFLKSKEICKCTFRLPKAAAPEAESVYLVGDFNGWDTQATPMKKLKSGEFKVEVSLDAGRDYEFRYLIDNERWENDWAADSYRAGAGTDENSVVSV